MKNLSRAGLLLLLLAAAGTAPANFVESAEKIDINAAPLENLVKIIHIGETRAKELISLRPFSSLDDLRRINGIGVSRIADIKKQGLAWVAESEQIEPEKEVAALGNLIEVKPQFPNLQSFVFLIAFIMAVFSGIIILSLKKKLKIV